MCSDAFLCKPPILLQQHSMQSNWHPKQTRARPIAEFALCQVCPWLSPPAACWPTFQAKSRRHTCKPAALMRSHALLCKPPILLQQHSMQSNGHPKQTRARPIAEFALCQVCPWLSPPAACWPTFQDKSRRHTCKHAAPMCFHALLCKPSIFLQQHSMLPGQCPKQIHARPTSEFAPYQVCPWLSPLAACWPTFQV